MYNYRPSNSPYSNNPSNTNNPYTGYDEYTGNGNYNYNNGQPPYSYYQSPYSQPLFSPSYAPPRRKSSGGWLAFFFLVLLVIGATFFTEKYVNNDGISLPGGGQNIVAPSTGSGSPGYGFNMPANDPLSGSEIKQYALTELNASQAWKVTTGSSNIIVAVIDTGVDQNQPALQGKLVSGYDFVPNDTTTTDVVGHGTFVASIIAAGATSQSQSAISGIAPNVRIMPLKVTNQAEAADSNLIAEAIRYAADHGAKVINLSLGGPDASTDIASAISYALSKQVIVVAAAGNEGTSGNPIEYPASFPGVISVAAVSSRERVASFSNHNQYVDLSAPGVNIIGARSQYNQICQPYPSQNYCVASGTSLASPYVAGTAALVLSVNPKLSVNQVTSILENTAQDLGTQGRDSYYGYGLVNAAQAVQAAKSV